MSRFSGRSVQAATRAILLPDPRWFCEMRLARAVMVLSLSLAELCVWGIGGQARDLPSGHSDTAALQPRCPAAAYSQAAAGTLTCLQACSPCHAASRKIDACSCVCRCAWRCARRAQEHRDNASTAQRAVQVQGRSGQASALPQALTQAEWHSQPAVSCRDHACLTMFLRLGHGLRSFAASPVRHCPLSVCVSCALAN